MVWARHAFAGRDWSKGSASHGNAKVIGTMPQGFDLTDIAGMPTAEAEAFVSLLSAVASQDQPVVVKPFGSEVDYLTNSSAAWQVWSELMTNAERAAARIYLGTDGTLGATGGAPGVDIEKLFGVARTRVEGDLMAIARGFQTGLVEPWCAINFGDTMHCPVRRFAIPNADQSAVVADYAARSKAFHEELSSLKTAGLVVDQAKLDEMTQRYVVDPVTLATAQADPGIAS
jgi:hypothetical protein